MIKQVYDVAVIGGSIGGCLAAYQASKQGLRVVLTEETEWIGGQLTNQGVPSDEHIYIEDFGCTDSYRKYREKVRDFYRNHPFVKEEIKVQKVFNPGSGWVSRISHDPRLAKHLFEELLLPFIMNGKLVIKTRHRPLFSVKEKNTIKEVIVENCDDKELISISAKYFIDGTDTGELLPLTNTDYVTGSEGKIYNEPHASNEADPEDMQPITWVVAVSYHEGENHTIPKPEMYDYFSQITYGNNIPLLSWYGPTLNSNNNKRKFKFNGAWDDKDPNDLPPLFSYRQVINKALFTDNYDINDATLINWPQNDYLFGNVYESHNSEYHKYMARQLSLSLVHWLQKEAPRDDGKGVGYPEIKLRGDILGTVDGLAMAPYIRESRRIKALYTVKEQDIAKNTNETLPHFWDTVGIGYYQIDVHMTTKTRTHYFTETWPFEIPLGAMIPVNTKNLIPGCKNIGTTHVTNGCFRLHPVEWNIGESAGLLATYCIQNNLTPKELYLDKEKVKKFQAYLIQNGISLHWPKHILK